MGNVMNEDVRTTAAVGPAPWLRRARLLIVSGLLALAGCMGGRADLFDDDPIRGGGRIPANAITTGGARGVAAADAGATGPPSLPPAQSPSSNAALAVGASGMGGDRQPAGADAGVKLGGPRATEARLTPVAATTGGLTPASAVVVTPGAAAGSYEQLQEMLRARGVVWQQLKTTGNKDEWHFHCAVPQAGLDNIERTYEARAVGPLGLAAIRAVIAEIDQDRGGR
jgi:hypothetical protein